MKVLGNSGGREGVKIGYLLFHSWKYRFSEREQALTRKKLQSCLAVRKQ